MRKNENAWKNAMYNYSRFFVVCLVAFAMVFMSYPYSLYAAETASDTIVQEAKNESELLLSLRTALWLRYMDVRNAYTKDYKAWISGGKVGAEPTPPGEFNTFTLSGLTGTYLPDSFPISDYSIATQGKELVLSKNISTATANIVPNFIPLAQITPATAEDSTVEFFVSRPGATAEFDMEEYVWKDRPNTMASPATLEWENWDTDLGAKTGVESFIAVNKTFLRTIEGANGSILSFGTPGVTSLTGDLDIANTLTATDGTFTTLQAATMDLTGDMDIDGTLTVANVDIQNKILSDMTLANDKEIKLDEGAVRLKASGTDLSVNNNEGYITMGRHGTQARFNTNADEFYFGKNIRVARLLGKADESSHADSASALDEAGNWSDIKNYINNKVKNHNGFNPIRLSQKTDLNDLINPGLYYCPNNTDVTTCYNTPTKYAFSLFVEKHAGVKQTLTEYMASATPKIWFRNYYNGVWGPWNPIYATQVITKTGKWSIAPKDIIWDRTGPELWNIACAKGGAGHRQYLIPNRNASGAKTWYSFYEMISMGAFGRGVTSIASKITSVTVCLEGCSTWDSAFYGKAWERNIGTGEVKQIINIYKPRGGSWNYGRGNIVLKPGYEYGFQATFPNVCGESYDDGYGARIYVVSYQYVQKL